MIEIYNSDDLYLGKVNSIRGACLATRENARTIKKRLNRPSPENQFNYYTRDERGHLIRLAYEIMQIALATPYPNIAQIGTLSHAKKELMKW